MRNHIIYYDTSQLISATVLAAQYTLDKHQYIQLDRTLLLNN
jgi:hypothetical protein